MSRPYLKVNFKKHYFESSVQALQVLKKCCEYLECVSWHVCDYTGYTTRCSYISPIVSYSRLLFSVALGLAKETIDGSTLKQTENLPPPLPQSSICEE